VGAPNVPAASVTTTIDNFSATALPILPFSEKFSTNNPAWPDQQLEHARRRLHDLRVGRQGTAGVNSAILGRVAAANVDMQANVSVPNTGGFAALTARASNAADPDC